MMITLFLFLFVVFFAVLFVGMYIECLQVSKIVFKNILFKPDPIIKSSVPLKFSDTTKFKPGDVVRSVFDENILYTVEYVFINNGEVIYKIKRANNIIYTAREEILCKIKTPFEEVMEQFI